MATTRLLLPLLALSLYNFYFLNLGNFPFLGADEPRYARIGEEMLLTQDFVTPTLNFRPWLEKPLFYFGLRLSVSVGSVFLNGRHDYQFPFLVCSLR